MNQRFAEKIPSWLTIGRIKGVLVLLLLLWIASRLASLFWVSMDTFFLKETTASSTSSVASSAPAVAKVSLSSLQNLKLFGDGQTDAKGLATEKVKSNTLLAKGEVPNDAPVTKLPIKLTGVISGGDSVFSTAMIVSGSKEESFRVEDKLPPNNRAVLMRVLPDRIIISNAGRYESVLLYDTVASNGIGSSPAAGAKSTAGAASKANKVAAAKQKGGVTSGAGDNTAAVDEGKRAEAVSKIKEMVEARDTQGLMKIINLTPAQGTGGAIKGYKVFPGRDKEMFDSLGLKRGDMVTAVNGTSLTDPKNAAAVMKEVSAGGNVTFTIEQTDGSIRDLSLDI